VIRSADLAKANASSQRNLLRWGWFEVGSARRWRSADPSDPQALLEQIAVSA